MPINEHGINLINYFFDVLVFKDDSIEACFVQETLQIVINRLITYISEHEDGLVLSCTSLIYKFMDKLHNDCKVDLPKLYHFFLKIEPHNLIEVYRNCSHILMKAKNINKISMINLWFQNIQGDVQVSLIAIENIIGVLESNPQVKNQLVEDFKSKKNFDLIKQTLERLWQLFDYTQHHEKVIELLVNLSSLFPFFFTEVVSLQF